MIANSIQEQICPSLFFYGLPLGIRGITALLVRSAGFWFPLSVGLVAVQIMGTRNVLSQSPMLRRRVVNKNKIFNANF